MLNTLISILSGWITSVWTLGRLIFSGLNTELMINCAQLLGIIFIIGVIDNLPHFFKRAERKEKKRTPTPEEAEEWVLIKRSRT